MAQGDVDTGEASGTTVRPLQARQLPAATEGARPPGCRDSMLPLGPPVCGSVAEGPSRAYASWAPPRRGAGSCVHTSLPRRLVSRAVPCASWPGPCGHRARAEPTCSWPCQHPLAVCHWLLPPAASVHVLGTCPGRNGFQLQPLRPGTFIHINADGSVTRCLRRESLARVRREGRSERAHAPPDAGCRRCSRPPLWGRGRGWGTGNCEAPASVRPRGHPRARPLSCQRWVPGGTCASNPPGAAPRRARENRFSRDAHPSQQAVGTRQDPCGQEALHPVLANPTSLCKATETHAGPRAGAAADLPLAPSTRG